MFSSRRSTIFFTALLPILLSTGCGGDGADVADEPITIAGVGFATPESVLHDSQEDVYLVSNINGSSLDKDGNGFISRVSTSGEVLDLKWIDGEAEGVTLNAPKGMTFSEGVLYVSDIDVIRRFDRESGEYLGEIIVEGATFVNDLGTDPWGNVYFTDTGVQAGEDGFVSSGTASVWRIDDDGPTRLTGGDALAGPDGVALDERGIWVVSFGSNLLYRVNEGIMVDKVELPAGSLGGIEILADSTALISSWETHSIYRGPITGPFEVIVSDVDSPADIGIDRTRNRILIPLFQMNEVRIVPID